MPLPCACISVTVSRRAHPVLGKTYWICHNAFANSVCHFDHMMLHIVRYCHSKSFVCLSVCLSVTLRYCDGASDVNKDLGLKAKTKDLDPKAKAQGLESQGQGQGRETQGQGQGLGSQGQGQGLEISRSNFSPVFLHRFYC